MSDEEKVITPGQSGDQPGQSEQPGEKSPEPGKPDLTAGKTDLTAGKTDLTAGKTDLTAGKSDLTADKPAPPRAAPPDKPAPPKAAPAKKPSITSDIAGDPFIENIKQRFGAAITEAVETLGQQILRVNRESYLELCRFLHDDDAAQFDMCTDLTATHWPERSGREFEVVLLLYSVPGNRRIRVKVSLADGEACPSVVGIWSGANWMEREAFDMFGIKFDGHPDLKRILLPEDWPGHPLRKEYPIEYRDNEWTDKHIEYRDVDYDTSLIDVKYRERR